jgi:hypothetical protein
VGEKVVFVNKRKRKMKRLDPFFVTMYLIGRQEELKCCLFAENQFIRGFV